MSALVSNLPLALAAGLALGFLGGVGHLAVTWWRASRFASRGAWFVFLTFPLGLAAPLVTIYLAARIAPAAAWVSPVGLLLARALLLRRLGGVR